MYPQQVAIAPAFTAFAFLRTYVQSNEMVKFSIVLKSTVKKKV